MSEKRPDPSFRGFTRRTAAPDMEDSPALAALRRLREDSASKASADGKEEAGSHPDTKTTASKRQGEEPGNRRRLSLMRKRMKIVICHPAKNCILPITQNLRNGFTIYCFCCLSGC